MMRPGGGRALLRRRASYILCLLGARAGRLWALPLLIRAIVEGIIILPRSMAPFILDDAVQMNANHAVADGDPTTLPPLDNANQTAAAAADRPEDISIALEWKLLLPLLLPGHDDPQPHDARPLAEARRPHDPKACLEQAIDSVARTIKQQAGEQAVTMHGLLKAGVEERDFWGSSWVVKKANSAEPLNEEKACKGYVWVPVEICSPKMRFQDPKTRARMQRVLDALTAGHRIAANCTCEVHVHLGRMDGLPWGLATLQRLGALLWAAEPTLRSIRDPRSRNADNLYTWGFAMHQRSRLAKILETSPPTPSRELAAAISDSQIMAAVVQGRSSTASPSLLIDGIVRICGTASHLELGQLLSGTEKMYRRLGFNFSAFGQEDERARRNPRTMEFRMMDGSVDAHLIMGWLAICGTIAETAVARGDGRYAAALDVLLLQRAEGCRRRRREAVGVQRGREFRELMLALGVAAGHFRGFEGKIRREHY